MAKPINDWNENIVRGEDVRAYLDKRLVIGTCDRQSYNDNYINFLANDGYEYYNRFQLQNMYGISVNKRGYNSYIDGVGSIIKRYLHCQRPNKRIIGVVNTENDDGSLEITLYGDNVNISVGSFKTIELLYSTFVSVPYDNAEDKIGDMPSLLQWGQDTSIVRNSLQLIQNYYRYAINGYDAQLDENYFDYFKLMPSGSAFLQWHCEQNGQLLGRADTLHLTTDRTTITMGVHQNNRDVNRKNTPSTNLGLIDNAVEGDLFDLMSDAYYNTLHLYSNIKLGDGSLPEGIFYLYDFGDEFELFSYAQYYKLFNVPITHSTSQALKYISDGTLPDDVFLYPFNLENLPTTDGIPPSDETGDSPKPTDENGDNGIIGTPTEDSNPAITPNMLTNNNLYWLQAGQLEAFITWFWQNAGEIIELDDLWDRIRGLYNDLASAIVNIRYFPVDVYYIGGKELTNDIIISSVKMPIQNIYRLKKSKLVKRVLGAIDIAPKYNAFTDFSPYTELMLYLPFHGWISLDIDLFMGNTLEVKCIYDHITGTIQYGIYCVSKKKGVSKEYLVNTVISKMAIDIPITLQSKNDRDSAIFNNVTNAFGNLLGAGASAVTGNPIGLVMSTAGVASSGAQSAPLKVAGTIGESGSYFLPSHCCIYIKRPSYNRPSNYASNVGYPCNQGGKLSSFSGLTFVYNPRISFSGNEYTDPDDGTKTVMKPLKEEIDEIYNYLEKGVIL